MNESLTHANKRISSRQLRVLIVDNDTAILDSLNLLLCCMGHGVSVATGVTEATDAAIQRRPDVLITDFRLTDGTGFDVIDAVRGATQTSTPAVIFTGDTTTTPLDGLNLPQCQVVRKPIASEQLLHLIDTMTVGDIGQARQRATSISNGQNTALANAIWHN